MAYISGNLRKLMQSGIDNTAPGGMWQYESPVDSAATVQGAGYISDGQDQGMQIGDLVLIHDKTNIIWKTAQVLSLAAAPSRAVNLSTTAQTFCPAT